MAQLSIPQSLIGALIDIANLGTLDYFPPTERCAHWSLYDAQRRELLCPCAPAANATTEKLFEAAAKILYENFPRYIDSPEEIIPYTSRQELVAALRRGEEEPAEEEQSELQVAATAADPVTEVEAEVETISAEPAATEDAEVSAADTPQPAAPKPTAPKPAAPKPVPSPALFAARTAQAPSSAPSVPEEASVEAPAEAVAEETVPTPATVAPAAPKPAAPKPVAPKPVAPTPGAPSPGMFRKSTLTYRPPRIEEYLEGLRARQQAAEAAEAAQSAAATEQAAVEDQPVLAQSLPSAPAVPTTSGPKPTAPKPPAPELA